MRWANGSLYGPSNIFVYSQGDRYYGQWVKDRQEGNNTHTLFENAFLEMSRF